MKVVYDLSDPALSGPCAASIGNFDGLHLGHRSILNTVVEKARLTGVSAAVLTFDPHPVRVLAPERAPKLLSTLSQKLHLIESAGVDLVFLERFDEAFAALSPEAFVRKYLVEGLRAKTLCVGSNFTFGHRQAGTVETLRQWRDAFDVIEVPQFVIRGAVASSTQVRRRVQEGNVSRACRLLGRWYEIEGRIVSGAGRGRNLTVPTLNLDTENELLPRPGVYITRMAINAAGFADSVTNIGMRPTFGGERLTVETFILNAPVPERAATARLQFLRRLRDERRFDSPALLREQIGRDVNQATRFFRMLEADGHARVHSH